MNVANPFARAAERVLGDGELAVFLVTIPIILLVVWAATVYFPVLVVGILLAYLMDGIVLRMSRRINPTAAISLVLAVSILFLLALLLFGIPQLTTQIANFAQNLARAVPDVQNWLDNTLGQLPDWMGRNLDSEALLDEALASVGNFATELVGSTVANAGNLFTLLVYAVLMPLLVFFLLRDKHRLFAWVGRYIPHGPIYTHLYTNLHEHFGSYVRGKFIEGGAIFGISMTGFVVLGLNYAFLLAVAIGLSVIIPFVGAVAVTFPVVAVALLQFGLEPTFWYVVTFYAIVQALDGQLLVPLLFSEVVRIHPVGLLVALVVFGSIWGLWGVFFAIPLASLIKCFILAVEARLAEKRTL